MATITMQRDLVATLKKETLLNIGMLSKLYPISGELSQPILKENALEKPTQNFFNHLSHYLVKIIDPSFAATLSWPLYDTKTERAYRNEFSRFISDYSSKGLLHPVMSSYLVNPGSYKVTMLVYQLSQLAVQKTLASKMNDQQKKMYNDMTNSYKSQSNDFMDEVKKETEMRLNKFTNYIKKRKVMEKVADMLRKKITEMEATLKTVNAQNYIENIIDGFVDKYTLDGLTKSEILEVKQVNKQSEYLERCLLEMDKQIDELESTWDLKMTPFLTICQKTRNNAEQLIERHTGEADKSLYMIEYNPKSDEICTKDLQSQVNSEQKYILKNIVKDDKLSFPNLIRSFLIAISFILKNSEIGEDVYVFNQYLDGGRQNYMQLVTAMQALVNRILNAESKLEGTTNLHDTSVVRDFEIPPMPDLSGLKATRDLHNQSIDPLTPLNISKHQFNLLRRNHSGTFTRPSAKSLLVTPFCYSQNDFLKSVNSCRNNAYDNLNITQNFHNMSVIPQTNRCSETISECSAGFTKQQILRLLSTRKSSSSKKFKYKTDRPSINIKKGGLFNETNNTNENILFRSHSSPNLFENREKKVFRGDRKKLSIMPEYSPTLLELSGIVALDKGSNYSTPQGAASLTNSNLAAGTEEKVYDHNIDRHDLDKDIKFNKQSTPNSIIEANEESKNEIKTETPKTNLQLIRKTSSLEKIINRFKKVRANVVLDKTEDIEFKTIVEEKENVYTNGAGLTANRILLPDLLSPSCSGVSRKSAEYLDQICIELDEKMGRKPRESLGTALGVDNTFLDQFDLID